MIDESLTAGLVRNIASVGYSRREIAACVLGLEPEPTDADVARITELYRVEIDEGEAMLRANPERMNPSRRLWRRAEAGDREAILMLALSVFDGVAVH